MTALATLLGRAQQTTTRVCSELRNAQLVWANFEAIYGIEGAPRDQFAERVYSVSVSVIPCTHYGLRSSGTR